MILRISFTWFLCTILFYCSAQEKKYSISATIDINQAGWNKVLAMKNGNTMLFHFEIDKPLVVIVYDSSHKGIATQKHLCRILDGYLLKEAVFKGMFEINGEAVLFVDQEHLSRHNLIRLRFSGEDGKLIEEKLAGESASMTKRTLYSVI